MSKRKQLAPEKFCSPRSVQRPRLEDSVLSTNVTNGPMTTNDISCIAKNSKHQLAPKLFEKGADLLSAPRSGSSMIKSRKRIVTTCNWKRMKLPLACVAVHNGPPAAILLPCAYTPDSTIRILGNPQTIVPIAIPRDANFPLNPLLVDNALISGVETIDIFIHMAKRLDHANSGQLHQWDVGERSSRPVHVFARPKPSVNLFNSNSPTSSCFPAVQRPEDKNDAHNEDQPVKKRYQCNFCGVAFLSTTTLNGHQKFYCNNRFRDSPASSKRTTMSPESAAFVQRMLPANTNVAAPVRLALRLTDDFAKYATCAVTCHKMSPAQCHKLIICPNWSNAHTCANDSRNTIDLAALKSGPKEE